MTENTSWRHTSMVPVTWVVSVFTTEMTPRVHAGTVAPARQESSRLPLT